MFRRELRQQLLVLALLVVAVAATVLGLSTATNGQQPSITTLTLPGHDDQLAADLAALQQRYGPLPVTDHQPVSVPGSVATLDLRAQDPNGGPLRVRAVSGRLPTAADEVAITKLTATLLGVRVGGTWTTGGRELRVVGIVENPLDLHQQFVLAPPGGIVRPDSVSVVLPTSAARPEGLRLPSGAPISIEGVSGTAKAAAATAVLALSSFGLLFVGLVAVAGFTVLAQRRMRAVGMLGALGATDRHVRLVMLAHGAIVGVAAAVAGGLLGIATWLVVQPWLETSSGHRIDRFDLPWWAIAAALAMSVVTPVVAAWWPARVLSRTSVMTALSSRPPRPRPAHRFAAAGGLLALGGAGLLALAHERRPLLAIAGTITSMVGVLLFAPLAIRALAAAGRRAPIAVRLAVRDLARYQARSAAALGAITLAVGLAATITITAAYHDALDSQAVPNLPSSQLVVYAAAPEGPTPVLDDAAVAAARSQVNAMAATLGTHDQLELERAVDPAGPGIDGPRGKGKLPAGLVHETPQGNGFRIDLVAAMYVGTPAVLQHYGIRAADIGSDVDVLTSRTDVAGATLGVGPRRSFPPKVQHVDLPPYRSAPNTLITSGAVVRQGLQEVPYAWLLDAGHPLRPSEVAAARKSAAAAGLSIETRDTSSSASEIGRRVTVAGIVLALGVLALTVGLIRSETAHDLRTLAATGAGRGTRRTLTGVTAGALALLGALLGVGGGYLAIVAWYRSHLHPMTHVPYANLAVILVGMPLLAAAGGWLFSGRMPEAIARRPLD